MNVVPIGQEALQGVQVIGFDAISAFEPEGSVRWPLIDKVAVYRVVELVRSKLETW